MTAPVVISRFLEDPTRFDLNGLSNRMLSSDPRKREKRPWAPAVLCADDMTVVSPASSRATPLVFPTVSEAKASTRSNCHAMDVDIPLNLPPQERLAKLEEAIAASAIYGYEPGYGIGFREFMAQKYGFHVERAVRKRSAFDNEFFFAPWHDYSEVFRLTEHGSIVCVDFNSMFPWAVRTQRFPHPGRLEYAKGYAARRAANDPGKCGLFHCVLVPRPESIELLRRLLPIQSFNGVSLAPVGIDERGIRVRLHSIEIETLHPHADIDVIEGVFSDAIHHPLARFVDDYYRMKSEFSGMARQVAKSALTTMHSSTARRRMHRAESLESACALLRSGLFERPGYVEQTIDDRGRYGFRAFHVANDGNAYCLTSTVIATARMRLFETLRCAEAFSEPCYANIDSMHFRSSSDGAKRTLDALHGRFGVGEGIGQLKVEAEGDAGLWLSPGVYFIGREGRIIKHASVDPDNPWETRLRTTHRDPVSGDPVDHSVSLFSRLRINKPVFENRFERLKPEAWQKPEMASLIMLNNRPVLHHAFHGFMRHYPGMPS